MDSGSEWVPGCRHRDWKKRRYQEDGGYICGTCLTTVSPAQQRTGRTVRQYGIRAELDAARTYGGSKTNDGGPVDIEGVDWNTQMKTKRSLPPKMWTKAFAAMPDDGSHLKRLLIRYVQGPGKPPIDYIVVEGKTWLEWWGRDALVDEA